MALASIKIEKTNQQQVNKLTEVYLPSYAQHVDSISLEVDFWGEVGASVTVRQLTTTLTKLSSLTLDNLYVQLQPGDGFQGVLGAAAVPLKQLQLSRCMVQDGEEGLAAALALLPGLEHLSLRESYARNEHDQYLPLCLVIPALPQLTYLELWEGWNRDRQHHTGLQHLTALTRLVDLRLALPSPCRITASMLSGAEHLTRLELYTRGREVLVDPAILAGNTNLQCLNLCGPLVGTAGTAQLLCELQQLQQLTCLMLCNTLHGTEATPPAAAYSTLTASSKLQRLDLVVYGSLPASVWQLLFPAGRQLPHLQALHLDNSYSSTGPAAAPEGTRLASCCPGLQDLSLEGLQSSRGLLAGLQVLSSLTKLHLQPADSSLEGWAEDVYQLTGLSELRLSNCNEKTLLLQLTQLRQLTSLYIADQSVMALTDPFSCRSIDGGEPVWRQVLRCHLNDIDPEVAQLAAAALAE